MATGPSPLAANSSASDHSAVQAFAHRERDSTTFLQADALSLLPAQLKTLGIRKPMLITGASVRSQPSYQRVLSLLDPWQPVILTPVPSHASVQWVTQAAQV
ncbi:MAG: hypothetical protein RL655_1374, partial [Pseudomonadota bacterium]